MKMECCRFSLSSPILTRIHSSKYMQNSPSKILNTNRYLRQRKFVLNTQELNNNGVYCRAFTEIKESQSVEKQCSEETMKSLVAFLEEDLPHLFDEQGIDKRMYDDEIEFRDPITKYDSLEGYLFNIRLLRLLFRPDFVLHSAKQTNANEITTRWTMVMKFGLLPWKPELVFTGTSVLAVNPETGKFCSHVDYWDSIKQNDYFSLEGFLEVLKQLRIYKTPDLETPKYQILKKAADYEVRQYEPFIVAEAKSDGLVSSSGFGDVAGYLFGKNDKQEKMKMTTPVFTEMIAKDSKDVNLQFVLPLSRNLSDFPKPIQEGVKLKQTQEAIAAALKFSGKVTEEIAMKKAESLRASLIRDGYKPKPGCMLARYNDPDRTWDFIMRNEVIIWLEDFSLE